VCHHIPSHMDLLLWAKAHELQRVEQRAGGCTALVCLCAQAGCSVWLWLWHPGARIQRAADEDCLLLESLLLGVCAAAQALETRQVVGSFGHRLLVHGPAHWLAERRAGGWRSGERGWGTSDEVGPQGAAGWLWQHELGFSAMLDVCLAQGCGVCAVCQRRRGQVRGRVAVWQCWLCGSAEDGGHSLV